ncbi:MAG: replication-relaxation family protein [Sandaracinaceae bacterium]|nr:replication-relaxation family protein [Sandaracinaceae bacterium]
MPHRTAITPRVVRVLVIIGRFAIASVADHVARLEFPDTSTAHRLIARCNGMRLVTVHVQHLNAGNLVTLTAKGRAVAAASGADPDTLHAVRRVGVGAPHVLAINDVRAAIALAARARTDLRLDEVVSDLDVRRWMGARARSREAVIPDLLVRLSTGAGELRLAWEIDLASERSSQWRRKVRALVDLYRSGADLCGLPHPWRPVVVAPDEARLRSLARVVVEEGGGALFAGAVHREVVADPFGPHYAPLALVAEGPSGDALQHYLVAPPAAAGS